MCMCMRCAGGILLLLARRNLYPWSSPLAFCVRRAGHIHVLAVPARMLQVPIIGAKTCIGTLIWVSQYQISNTPLLRCSLVPWTACHWFCIGKCQSLILVLNLLLCLSAFDWYLFRHPCCCILFQVFLLVPHPHFVIFAVLLILQCWRGRSGYEHSIHLFGLPGKFPSLLLGLFCLYLSFGGCLQ